ncbi:PTS-dependent dihydroxyacetone kinase phosphotransferase subunit DhaM [Virgibacillus halodenitrificans]|uniref:dihydroxyacetone kinase phosphoryl donor subunit DhaM n=1 Tax=Virgibacillus halodenitrificans TaxID=1482 RepID=UPI00045CE55F|nr:dihydroxyacetone kinase phosphoryl donor subunit DhaM [Virgibacillus halodenitrificans]MCG1028865.1 PTS-dependent dihydroxyacetone kinase phosphotransferase subunit DhaM [Virgibacillus halodenitrificans]MEC2160804.1 dihydroxyacetone kinase phosphoryl donor subunit DhaM [Virgibacillus halodenitrificans]CDQ32628.1 PTS-dependent dihydroxyacetone kinase, phosphotransferase subunit DhaM [Virgibacillus halodenitrificans]
MAYVGIVLISHSPKVVEGTKEIIRQVNQDVAIELAGGTDDNEIGTSIDKILEAINHADKGSGVLLLYDIGSAKMNAEIAIEMADGNNIKMAEAPIVEGAYVASVEAGMGKSVEEIITTLEKNF